MTRGTEPHLALASARIAGCGDTRSRIFVALSGAALLLAACGGPSGEARDASGDADDAPAPTLRVVTSIGIFADWVAQVAGDRATASALVPAGADIHTFALTPAAAATLAAADAVVLGGGGLEGQVTQVAEQNAEGAVLVLSDGLLAEDGDPHFWLDIERAITAVGRIQALLTRLDPEGAPQYAARAAAYIADLRRLDGEIRALLDPLPPERRRLVTYHGAFGYWARRYGLTIAGTLVDDPEAEPSPARLAALVRVVEREGLAYVFAEPQHGRAAMEQLAREAGAELRVLYSDAFTDDVPTYVDLMRSNAHAVAD